MHILPKSKLISPKFQMRSSFCNPCEQTPCLTCEKTRGASHFRLVVPSLPASVTNVAQVVVSAEIVCQSAPLLVPPSHVHAGGWECCCGGGGGGKEGGNMQAKMSMYARAFMCIVCRAFIYITFLPERKWELGEVPTEGGRILLQRCGSNKGCIEHEVFVVTIL